MNRYRNGIGTALYELRRKQGISKIQLAESTHLDIVYIDLIERNKKMISVITLKKLAKALHTQPDVFDPYKIQT